jgi:hypothetical protein
MGEGKQLKDKVQLVMGKVIFHYNHHWDKRWQLSTTQSGTKQTLLSKTPLNLQKSHLYLDV